MGSVVGSAQSGLASLPQAQLVAAVAEYVKQGECILFLGAGVHSPPPDGSGFTYPEAERPLRGGELAEHLARQCRFQERLPHDSPRDLQRVSFCYELDDTKGRGPLIAEIDKVVNAGKRPSPVLRGLAALGFPLVVTTNYDLLFERALATAGKSPQIVVYSKNPQDATRDPLRWNVDEPLLFKIHGDIQHPETIVITDEDYIHFLLRMGNKEPYYPIPDTFLYHFKRWPTLFVGYSLLDYNLRLLFKTMRSKVDRANFPQAYSVDPSPDVLIVQVYSAIERYVAFIVQDVWTFVPQLYQLVRGQEMPQ